MKFKSKHYRKWFAYGGIGAVLMGTGLSMIVDAAFLRNNGVVFWDWVIYGTLALCVFMAGISFFGDAILSKVRYEKEQEK
jgi:hypothetical protein